MNEGKEPVAELDLHGLDEETQALIKAQISAGVAAGMAYDTVIREHLGPPRGDKLSPEPSFEKIINKCNRLFRPGRLFDTSNGLLKVRVLDARKSGVSWIKAIDPRGFQYKLMEELPIFPDMLRMAEKRDLLSEYYRELTGAWKNFKTWALIEGLPAQHIIRSIDKQLPTLDERVAEKDKSRGRQSRLVRTKLGFYAFLFQLLQDHFPSLSQRSTSIIVAYFLSAMDVEQGTIDQIAKRVRRLIQRRKLEFECIKKGVPFLSYPKSRQKKNK